MATEAVENSSGIPQTDFVVSISGHFIRRDILMPASVMSALEKMKRLVFFSLYFLKFMKALLISRTHFTAVQVE